MLFDMVGEEEKEQFEIKLPDVGEYSKENLLAFEKEVLVFKKQQTYLTVL